MAGSSSAVFFGMIEGDQKQQMKQQHSSEPPAPPAPPQKKRRNQPGNPNPDAEVVALSPKTLMATNRFVCEVCNKGFQREQNLQLHRRGHNLPWKLKQKTTKELKKKVYLCPEPTCVHHDPSRALGDLTGIKKHFSRKHGEKRFNCDKCTKKYAVYSDWKAHSKTCGTKEYRCDCGTLFSRRDSFVTHRAFCDALAQETARTSPPLSTTSSQLYGTSKTMTLALSQVGCQVCSSQDQNQTTTDTLRLGGNRTGLLASLTGHSGSGSAFRRTHSLPSSGFFMPESNQEYHEESKPYHGIMPQFQDILSNPSNPPPSTSLFNLSFFSNGSNENNNTTNLTSASLFNIPIQFNNGGEGSSLFSGDQITSGVPSLYSTSVHNHSMAPPLSATALLQRAAQLGSSSSNSTSSLLKIFGSSSSSGIKSDQKHIFDNNFCDLMNSLAGGSSIVLGGGSVNPYGGNGNEEMHNERKLFNLEQPAPPQTPTPPHGLGFGNMDHSTLHHNVSTASGGSDNLTRDFLGVGEIVRGISERKTEPSQAFGGGNFEG